MSVSEQVRDLRELRQKARQDGILLFRKMTNGSPESELGRYRQRWHTSVNHYLDALTKADVDADTVVQIIDEHKQRLENGMAMEPPGEPAARFRFDRHFEKLLVELEVCYDLQNGVEYTRTWLLYSDVQDRPNRARGKGVRALPGTIPSDPELETYTD